MEKLRNTQNYETTVIYLSGNPGCGKSEIARQIGYNFFNKIPEDTAQLKFVFTFNTSSIDNLLHSYVDFAARLNCDEDSVTRIATSKDLSPEEKIRKMKSLINPKMQIYSWWLIIVDDVNDLKLVSKYLPQAGEMTTGDGQILVTTQDSQSILLDSYSYHYSSLKLGMKEEDAIALLSQISRCTGYRDTLLKIASALDFQPLALACAAVYMQRILNYTYQSETKWEKYLLKLQEGKREATEEVYEKTTSTYQSAMTTAVRLALERVVSEDKIMMYALQFLSVIADEPIPLKYVVQYVIYCMPDEDQDLVAARVSLSSLIISSEDEENSKEIRVHQVVYYVLQKIFENDETDILKLMSVFSDLPSFKNAYNATKAEIIATRSFAPHFVVISKKLKYLLQYPSLTVESLANDCLFKAGCICLVQGSYKASEIFLGKCLSIQQRVYEDKKSYFDLKPRYRCIVRVALANTRKSLGQLYINLRDYKKAQIHLEAALVIQERLDKEDHPELAITSNNLGFCLRKLGEHDRAESCLHRALTIQEKYLDKTDILLACTLVNLVSLLQSQGEIKKAKMYFKKVLEIEENLCGIEDPQLAMTLNDLAVCFSRFEKKLKAMAFYEKALALMESVYDANHPCKAIVLRNLGVILLDLRRFEKAKAYLERALFIHEIGDDENNPQLPITLDTLGLCLLHRGQYENAKSYLERALSIREKSNIENDPKLAITLENLGYCLHELRQYEKAKTYLERAQSLHKKVGDENYQQLASTLDDVDDAKMYLRKGNCCSIL